MHLHVHELPTYFEFLDLGGRPLPLRHLPILIIAAFMLPRRGVDAARTIARAAAISALRAHVFFL